MHCIWVEGYRIKKGGGACNYLHRYYHVDRSPIYSIISMHTTNLVWVEWYAHIVCSAEFLCSLAARFIRDICGWGMINKISAARLHFNKFTDWQDEDFLSAVSRVCGYPSQVPGLRPALQVSRVFQELERDNRTRHSLHERGRPTHVQSPSNRGKQHPNSELRP